MQGFKRHKIAIFGDFHGLSVAKMQTLRRLLKKTEAEFKVAKKTLLDLALEKTGIKLKTKDLQGEIGVALGYNDEVEPAKVLFKFFKANEAPKILGGFMGERLLSQKDVVTLAKLPSKQILLAQLVSAMQSPIRGLITVLQGNIKKLVVILNKIKDKKS